MSSSRPWHHLLLLFLGGGILMPSSYPSDPAASGFRFRENLLPTWTNDISGRFLHFDLDGKLASDGVSIYQLTGQGWNQEVRLLDAPLRSYGNLVTVSGDTVGVVGFDDSTSLAYVAIYRHLPTGWSLEAKLTHPDPRDVGFGTVLDMDGDTLAVMGKLNLHVFRRNEASWTLEAQLTPSIGHSYFRRNSTSASRQLLGQGAYYSGELWSLKATCWPCPWIGTKQS